MSTKPDNIKYETTVLIYLIYPTATHHLHTHNFFPRAVLTPQVRNMHRVNQSTAVGKLLSI